MSEEIQQAVQIIRVAYDGIEDCHEGRKRHRRADEKGGGLSDCHIRP